MQNLTFQQLFGQSATQTATTLTIYKADLQGLTAAANNRGEQLLVALLLQAHKRFEGVLKDEFGDSITDEQNRLITYDNKEFYERITLSFWKTQFIQRNNQAYLLNTFVLDVFIKPPPDFGTPLSPNSLNYY